MADKKRNFEKYVNCDCEHFLINKSVSTHSNLAMSVKTVSNLVKLNLRVKLSVALSLQDTHVIND